MIAGRRKLNPLTALGVAWLLSVSGQMGVLHAANKLPTVVSLDYCADQYVLQLAARKQIAALSIFADQGHSFFQAKAKGLPKTHSTIEEILAIQPDLIIQSYMAAPRMTELTTALGSKTINTKYGSSADVVMRNITTIASALGQRGLGAQLTKIYESRIAALRALPKSPLTVAYITPSGFTAGSGTFVDRIIQLAGFTSYADAHGYRGWMPLPLENLITNPPDIFLTSFYDTDLKNRSNWSLSRHARLNAMIKNIPTIDLPGRFMACDGLFLAHAAERIRASAIEQNIIPHARKVSP